MKISRYLLTFLFLLLGINFAIAQENISPTERKAIQQKITKETAKKLKVNANRLHLEERFTRSGKYWIFMSFDIQNPSGQPFDYKGTHLYKTAQEEVPKNSVEALLQKENAHWELVDIAVNANHVAWSGWAKKHDTPSHLFNIICLRQTPEDCKALSQVPAAWRGAWYPPQIYGKYSTRYEPKIIITDQTITWEPCGPDARKVRVFSKFFGQSIQGLLLEIEGEPCSYTNYEDITRSISYIHLEKEEKENLYGLKRCPVAVAVYDSSDKLGAENNWEFFTYTKSTCSVFSNDETYEIYASIKKAVATQMETSKFFLETFHLESIGDWVFITEGIAIGLPETSLVGGLPADAFSHFIFALLRRKGNTWELIENKLVEKELDVAARKELYQEWSLRHHIPQDDSNKRICPKACP